MLEKVLITLAAATMVTTTGLTYAAGQAGSLGPGVSAGDVRAVAGSTPLQLSPGPHGVGDDLLSPPVLSKATSVPVPTSRTSRRKASARARAAARPAPVPVGGLSPLGPEVVGSRGSTDLSDAQTQTQTQTQTQAQSLNEDPSLPPGGTPTASGADPAAPAAPPDPSAPTSFTVASFNLLGSSHTKRSWRASGPARIPGALSILAQHQVSVAGFQEFQPDQRRAFAAKAPGWQTYPGMRDGGENSIGWRTDTWALVSSQTVPIPYFNGRQRPMPYVQLRNLRSGAEVWFANFHNPADVRQYQHQQRYRTEATTREIALFNRLVATGAPVVVTGDMNEREEYFCRVTGGTSLHAAAGGGNGAQGCRVPKPIGIDWIMASAQIGFSGYSVDRSPLVRRTTDHPVITSQVRLG